MQPPPADAASDLLGPSPFGAGEFAGLRDPRSLAVFKLWWQLGHRPPGFQEIAAMDAVLALDVVELLKLARRFTF